MTNKEFIAELSEQLEWTQVKVSEVLADTVDIISSRLADNATITIPNFGVFETRKRSERISVNPQTKQRFLVPPKICVNFRAASNLKEKYE